MRPTRPQNGGTDDTLGYMVFHGFAFVLGRVRVGVRVWLSTAVTYYVHSTLALFMPRKTMIFRGQKLKKFDPQAKKLKDKVVEFLMSILQAIFKICIFAPKNDYFVFLIILDLLCFYFSCFLFHQFGYNFYHIVLYVSLSFLCINFLGILERSAPHHIHVSMICMYACPRGYLKEGIYIPIRVLLHQ